MKLMKFLIPLFALALLVGCTPSTPTNTQNSDSSTMTDGYGNPTGTSSMSTTSPDSMQQSSPANPTGFNGQILSGKHTVVIKTSKGNITLELDADKAPKTVTNFVVLSRMGYYNGLTFHRVIPNFMIQGGDPNGNGSGGASIYGDTFANEDNDIPMVKGTIAMANRGRDTNGSQFFIVQADATPWLQGGYTAFGKVTSGLDVVDAIANVPVVSTDPNSPEANRPVTPVTMDITVQE